MSSTIEIVYHPELNSIECVCGLIGTFHICTKSVRGNISLLLDVVGVSIAKVK